MPKIAISESDKSKMSMADILVRIVNRPKVPPPSLRYANINVIGKKPPSGTIMDGVIFSEGQKNNIKAGVVEFTELNFIGWIKFWNTDKITQDTINEMVHYGDTLVILSGRKDVIGQLKNFNLKDLIVWQTMDEVNDDNSQWVKQLNQGGFIDIDKQGKTLFTLSQLLQNPQTLKYTVQIYNTNFKGINDLDTSKMLDDLGYSHFIKADERCWARGVWIGGQQARAVYADRSVMYDVKAVISKTIVKGQDFNDAALIILEMRIMQAMSDNPFVTKLNKVNIPKQLASNKVQGIVSGIKVEYETASEVRTVMIEMGDDE